MTTEALTGQGGSLPPSVSINLSDSLHTYWRKRAPQVMFDSYAGVGMFKFPEDLRVYEHLLWESRANVVIELGAHCGGSTLWFRDRLRINESYGRISAPKVIAIDISTSLAERNIKAADPSGGDLITLIEASVTDPELPDRVAAMVPPGSRCFVIEDSAHTYETTAASLRGFAKFVPEDGYLVVEDGCVDIDALRTDPQWPRGVLPAVDEWLGMPEAQGFVLRRELELYGFTCHPRGFLQRTGPDSAALAAHGESDAGFGVSGGGAGAGLRRLIGRA